MNDNPFLNLELFAGMPPAERNEELDVLENEFRKLFGHGIPRESLPDGITDEKMMEALQACIREKKDDLLNRLGVKLCKGVRY